MNDQELKSCRKLAAAVLAKSLVDIFEFVLERDPSKRQLSKEDLDSAKLHVLEYKKLVSRLKTVKSRKALKKWLKELKEELE